MTTGQEANDGRYKQVVLGSVRTTSNRYWGTDWRSYLRHIEVHLDALGAVAAGAEMVALGVAVVEALPAPDSEGHAAGSPRGASGGDALRGLSPDWRSLVCGAPFTWPCEWALATIQCESSGNPNAVGVEWIDGIEYRFYGGWQVLNGATDPYLNTVEAHIQYVQWQRGERGRPWPGCP